MSKPLAILLIDDLAASLHFRELASRLENSRHKIECCNVLDQCVALCMSQQPPVVVVHEGRFFFEEWSIASLIKAVSPQTKIILLAKVPQQDLLPKHVAVVLPLDAFEDVERAIGKFVEGHKSAGVATQLPG